MRDSYALEAHRFFGLVGLSARRYGPGLHIFLFHQTPRILHSRNLFGVSTEGGGTHAPASLKELQSAHQHIGSVGAHWNTGLYNVGSTGAGPVVLT